MTLTAKSEESPCSMGNSRCHPAQHETQHRKIPESVNAIQMIMKEIAYSQSINDENMTERFAKRSASHRD